MVYADAVWHGTDDELRELVEALRANCGECSKFPITASRTCCKAHKDLLNFDQHFLDRLLGGRRMSQTFLAREFRE